MSSLLNDREPLLTSGEAAKLMGCTPRTVNERAVRAGIKPIRTPGGVRRFRQSEVRLMLRLYGRGRR